MIFTSQQRNFLSKALTYVPGVLGSEFETRTGFTPAQAAQLNQKMNEAPNSEPVAVNLTHEELSLVNNILNEVCNGMAIENFLEVLGFDKSDAFALLNIVHKLL